MDVNDEMIACYVDGTASEEECTLVRQYLMEHPKEMERVLFMMDRDRYDVQSENEECCISSSNSSPEMSIPSTVHCCYYGSPLKNIEEDDSESNDRKESQRFNIEVQPELEDETFDDEDFNEKDCHCCEAIDEEDLNVIGHRFMLMDNSVEDIFACEASGNDSNNEVDEPNFIDRLDDLLRTVDEEDV